MEQAVAFSDIPESWFPLRIVFVSSATKEPLREITIPGPGAVEIPGQKELGEPCDVHLYRADEGAPQIMTREEWEESGGDDV